MESHAHECVTTPGMLWTGRILTWLSAAFLLFDGGMKVAKVKAVMDACAKMGFPLEAIQPIGIVLVVCVVIYLIPRTAVLGAVLLTGYLGGAIATQVFVHSPPFELTFPLLTAVIVWLGVFLRDGRLRSLMPLRR